MSKNTQFASDNSAPVDQAVMEFLQKVNSGYVSAYGEDKYTKDAIAALNYHFGDRSEIFFVGTGTAANVLALKAMAQSHHAIFASECSHIYVDECNAPENFIGCKIIPLPTTTGKISIEQIEPYLHYEGDEHHPQPRVISITQCTEYGTVYTPSELHEICAFASEYYLMVHMDGARLANAAAFLNTSLADISKDVGIDVLSFGGTKSGMMFGEAVVFFNPELARKFKYIRKQGMQLFSKMRYVAAQFSAMMESDRCLANAKKANGMAQILATELSRLPGIQISQPVEANSVFAIMPPEVADRLRLDYTFYDWNKSTNEVRLMCSFQTQFDDIDKLIGTFRNILRD